MLLAIIKVLTSFKPIAKVGYLHYSFILPRRSLDTPLNYPKHPLLDAVKKHIPVNVATANTKHAPKRRKSFVGTLRILLHSSII